MNAQSLKIFVKDKSKEPLIGATVQVIRAGDSLTLNEVSDLDGLTSFLKMEPGIYTIYANYIGFKENISTIRIEKKSISAGYHTGGIGLRFRGSNYCC